MKRLGKIIISLILVISILSVYSHQRGDKVYAQEGETTIRVPFGASVYYGGNLVGEESVTNQGYKTGRIHDIARVALNQIYPYTEYKVLPLNQPDDLQVIDMSGTVLYPVDQVDGVIEYIGTSDINFVAAVSDRIRNAAIAYHNRCGGYGGNAAFGNYFLVGSDAYNKGIKSDEGRQYGQNVRAATINSVNISEIYRYSDSAFTAKVDIVASGSYVESYTIYFLFQLNGAQYYVTNYTYRD